MLCLQTANNDGELSLKFGEIIIPYNVDKIARDTKYFNKDTIIVAMELYKQLNLFIFLKKYGNINIINIKRNEII